MQKEIECAALAREKDKSSKERLKVAKGEIANLREELAPLNAKWLEDRGRSEELKSLREKLNTLQAKAAAAERIGDYEKAADLKAGKHRRLIILNPILWSQKLRHLFIFRRLYQNGQGSL